MFRYIRICSCTRESVQIYHSDQEFKAKFCPYCGDSYEYIKPPITGVSVLTEKTTNSYDYVSLEDFGEALMKMWLKDIPEDFQILFKDMIDAKHK